MESCLFKKLVISLFKTPFGPAKSSACVWREPHFLQLYLQDDQAGWGAYGSEKKTRSSPSPLPGATADPSLTWAPLDDAASNHHPMPEQVPVLPTSLGFLWWLNTEAMIIIITNICWIVVVCYQYLCTISCSPHHEPMRQDYYYHHMYRQI